MRHSEPAVPPGKLDAWLESLEDGESDIRIDLIRRMPKLWRGIEICGLIDTYDHAVTREEVEDQHGGGYYTLKVKVRDTSGRFVYWRSKNLSIDGAPKIGDEGNGETSAPWIRCPSCNHRWDTAVPSKVARPGSEVTCPKCEAILTCTGSHQPPRRWAWAIASHQHEGA